MPELPELEVVREVLQRRIVGQTITAVEVIQPGGAVVVRDLTQAGFAAALAGATIAALAGEANTWYSPFRQPYSLSSWC